MDDVDADLKAFMAERYKALCAQVDDYRNRGIYDEAEKLYETEVKTLLKILLGDKWKDDEKA